MTHAATTYGRRDGQLIATCTCERDLVLATDQQVFDGTPLSCGRPTCAGTVATRCRKSGAVLPPLRPETVARDKALTYATYRQIDYWTRCGYLPLSDPLPGYGTSRDYAPALAHIRAAAALAPLVDILSKEAIDELARTGQLTVDLPHGATATITLGGPS